MFGYTVSVFVYIAMECCIFAAFYVFEYVPTFHVFEYIVSVFEYMLFECCAFSAFYVCKYTVFEFSMCVNT